MMGVETTITASPNLAASLGALKKTVLFRAISRGMERGTLAIASRIQNERLSGRGPFPVAQQRLGIGRGDNKGYSGGRLRKAVRGTKPQTRDNEVTTSIGANVSYAAAHEFGFSGTVAVKAHEVTMTKLFGRKLKAPLRFSRLASKRNVKIPERRPFRAGIESNIGLLEREIAREVVNEVRKGGKA